MVVDRRSTVARWNNSAQHLFGWSARETVGRMVVALARPAGDAEALADALARAVAGEPWEGTLALSHRRGDRLVVALRVSPLQNGRGATVGAVIVAFESSAARAPARDANGIGARIAQARREAGLTQDAVAAALGVTRRSIQAYEAGVIIPYKHLDALESALGCAPNWLLGGDGNHELATDERFRAVLREELADALAELRVPRAS